MFYCFSFIQLENAYISYDFFADSPSVELLDLVLDFVDYHLLAIPRETQRLRVVGSNGAK